MKPGYISRVLLFFTTVLAGTTVILAQDAPALRSFGVMLADPNAAPGTPESRQRIIVDTDMTEEQAEAFYQAEVARETVILSFHVPDFDPADLDHHIYKVGFFLENGGGTSSAQPDNTGLVEVELQLPFRPVPADPGAKRELSAMLYSANLITGELLLTMDMQDVPLVKLVNALEGAMRNALIGYNRNTAALRGRRPVFPPAFAQEVRLDMRGDNLDIEAALDQIFEQTGCEVFNEAGSLVIRSCP